MDIAVTKQIIDAAIYGAEALRTKAAHLEDRPESKHDTSVGLIVRHNIELSRQHADLLDGFARRCADLIRLPETEGDRQ